MSESSIAWVLGGLKVKSIYFIHPDGIFSKGDTTCCITLSDYKGDECIFSCSNKYDEKLTRKESEYQVFIKTANKLIDDLVDKNSNLIEVAKAGIEKGDDGTIRLGLKIETNGLFESMEKLIALIAEKYKGVTVAEIMK